MNQDAFLPHPERIGPYRIESVLGQGGMGTVFLGRDQAQQPVAIKLAAGLDERGQRRFEREVGACRRLDHPGIVKVLDLGLHAGQPWYAMEYHSAVSLAQLLACSQHGSPEDLPALITAIERGELSPAPPHRRRLLPRTVAIDMMIDICAAVVHAHARGLIHRDLKPENILLDPAGKTLVADFGLVADLDQQRRLTQTGGVIGTLGYAAPEVLQAARTLDERTDVYALGVILRELLTGIQPGPDALRPATGGTWLQQDRQRLVRLPRPLRVVIERATHPRADRRYHSALALLADLQRFQRGDRVLARRDPWWNRLRPWFAHHRWPAAAMLVLGLSAGALGVRTFMLRRLEASRWGEPLLDLRSDDNAAIAQLLDPLRVPEADQSTTGAAHLLGAPAPVFGDQRIRATFRTGSAGGRIGIYLAAADDGGSGYHLDLPVADDRPASLSRGAEVLWLSGLQLEAQSTVTLELELHDHGLSARRDHRDLVRIAQPIPRFGGMAGASIRSAETGTAPVCTSLSLRGRTLPRFQPAGWLAQRLVGLLRDSEPPLRRALWDEVRTTCEEHLQRSDGSLPARHLLLSAWSAIAALPPALRPDGEPQELAATIETIAGSFPAA
ncbi:MAG: protein kinase domain-containing protein, partial [Planctomycetota bacterium]